MDETKDGFRQHSSSGRREEGQPVKKGTGLWRGGALSPASRVWRAGGRMVSTVSLHDDAAAVAVAATISGQWLDTPSRRGCGTPLANFAN